MEFFIDDYDVAVTEDDQGYPTAITLTKKM